ERLKKFEFLTDVHGHSEGLVAVTEIDAAPARRLREDTVRPATVGQMDRRERAVFRNWILQHVFVRSERVDAFSPAFHSSTVGTLRRGIRSAQRAKRYLISLPEFIQ